MELRSLNFSGKPLGTALRSLNFRGKPLGTDIEEKKRGSMGVVFIPILVGVLIYVVSNMKKSI